MPFIGNGIKSKETGKSGVKTEFTSLFISFHKTVYKIGSGKRKFVNRSKISHTLLLRKLIALFNVTYEIYIRDRHTREALVENNWNSPTDIYEENRNITLSILDGLNLIIENCIVTCPRQHRHLKQKDSIQFLVLLVFSNFYIYTSCRKGTRPRQPHPRKDLFKSS